MNNETSFFLKNLPLFAGLAEEEVAALGVSARMLGKGDRLFGQEEPADTLFVVMSGWIKLFRVTVEGEEVLSAMAGSGDLAGEDAFLEGAVYGVSAVAAEEARVIAVSGAALRARARSNPDISARMLAALTREVGELRRRNEHLAVMSAAQRVACLLLQISKEDGGAAAFPYDKALAAAELGMTPETFSRALGQLREIGVAVRGAEVQIENLERLACFSCGHCTAGHGECHGARLFFRISGISGKN